MKNKLYKASSILGWGTLVGLLILFTSLNIQAQELKKSFGIAKTTVKLDAFSGIPEADIP